MTVGRRWAVGVVVLTLATSTVAFFEYAGDATVVAAANGYVIEPSGTFVMSDDGPRLKYPRDVVPDLRLRVPVRNTSRLPLTVTYFENMYPTPYPDDRGPATTVRIPGRGTAELFLRYNDHGCGGTVDGGPDGSFTIPWGVDVTVHAFGSTGRDVVVALPIPFEVPGMLLPHPCGSTGDAA